MATESEYSIMAGAVEAIDLALSCGNEERIDDYEKYTMGVTDGATAMLGMLADPGLTPDDVIESCEDKGMAIGTDSDHSFGLFVGSLTIARLVTRRAGEE